MGVEGCWLDSWGSLCSPSLPLPVVVPIAWVLSVEFAKLRDRAGGRAGALVAFAVEVTLPARGSKAMVADRDDALSHRRPRGGPHEGGRACIHRDMAKSGSHPYSHAGILVGADRN